MDDEGRAWANFCFNLMVDAAMAGQWFSDAEWVDMLAGYSKTWKARRRLDRQFEAHPGKTVWCDEVGSRPTTEMGGGWTFPVSDPRTLPVPGTVPECEQWIEAVLRLPQGALAYLYRMLRDGRGINLDNERRLEGEWRSKK